MYQSQKFKLFNLIVTPVIFTSLIACNSESVDSDEVSTSGIWAKMEVDAREDERSRVVVELNVGGEFGTNVELAEGAYLEVEAGGVTKRLDEDSDFLDIDYQTYMDIVASDTLFTVRFYRSNGENIVNSSGRLPQAFQITAPTENTQYSLSESVLLTWTPAMQGQSISIFSQVSCTTAQGGITSSASSFEIDDSGLFEYDISSNGLFANGTVGLNTAALCDMKFRLERQANGNIDNAFHQGGRFKVYQSRRLNNLKVNIQP